MKDKDRDILRKIWDHARKVIKYSKNCKTYEEFAGSDLISDACIFNIMQIGELAKNELSDDAKNQIVSIPWKNIYGMRNRIVHGYSYVSMNIIWDTVRENIPALEKEISAFLNDKET
ncbi:MAG: DUF86 domain-containing protein [Deltaproteobacteria bacterium]|nr:DUF86 domain-containing protein [Deltaproteobacteria bacterium]